MASLKFLALLLFLSQPAMAYDGDRVVYVFDSSGSMHAPADDGQTLHHHAKRKANALISSYNATNTKQALVSFGDRGSCDVHIDVGFTTGTYGTEHPVWLAIKAKEPRGYTPLTDGIMQAARLITGTNSVPTRDHSLPDPFASPIKDLTPGCQSGAKIILLSDGMESCGGDPVALAQTLKNDYCITVSVVAIGGDDALGNYLSNIASAGGGSFESIASNSPAVSSSSPATGGSRGTRLPDIEYEPGSSTGPARKAEIGSVKKAEPDPNAEQPSDEEGEKVEPIQAGGAAAVNFDFGEKKSEKKKPAPPPEPKPAELPIAKPNEQIDPAPLL